MASMEDHPIEPEYLDEPSNELKARFRSLIQNNSGIYQYDNGSIKLFEDPMCAAVTFEEYIGTEASGYTVYTEYAIDDEDAVHKSVDSLSDSDRIMFEASEVLQPFDQAAMEALRMVTGKSENDILLDRIHEMLSGPNGEMLETAFNNWLNDNRAEMQHPAGRVGATELLEVIDLIESMLKADTQ